MIIYISFLLVSHTIHMHSVSKYTQFYPYILHDALSILLLSILLLRLLCYYDVICIGDYVLMQILFDSNRCLLLQPVIHGFDIGLISTSSNKKFFIYKIQSVIRIYEIYRYRMCQRERSQTDECQTGAIDINNWDSQY